MSNVLLEVIDEFLRSSDAQLRKNALTAAASVGTEDGVARVVRAALNDADRGVRERAELELSRLDGPSATHVAATVTANLNSGNAERDTYALLARLASRGWVAVQPPGRWLLRLRRALRFARSTRITWRNRLWLALGGMVGLGAYSLVLLVLLWVATGMLPTLSDGLSMVFLSGLLAGVTIVALMSHALPLCQHFDARAAVVIELARALVSAAVLAVVVILVSSISYTDVDGSVRTSWVTVGFIGIAAAVATRLGAYLAVGRTRGPWNMVTMAAVGTIFGSVVAGAGLFLAAGSGEGAASLAPNWYVFPLLLSVAGLATAGARLDAQPPAVRPFPRHIRTAALALAGVVAIGTVAWAWRRPEPDRASDTPNDVVIAVAAADEASSQSFTVSGGEPVSVAFTAEFPQHVDVTVEDVEQRDLEILLKKADGGVVAQFDDPNPPKLSTTVEPGNYVATVGYYGFTAQGGGVQGGLKLPVDSVLQILAQRGPVRSDRASGRPPYVVVVTLNAQRR